MGLVLERQVVQAAGVGDRDLVAVFVRHALEHLVDRLLTPRGVLVNAVCPGWVASDMGGAEASRTLEQGADSIFWAISLDDSGPTGEFFQDGKRMPW